MKVIFVVLCPHPAVDDCDRSAGGVDGEDIQVYRVPRRDIPAFVAAKRAEGFGVDVKMLIFLAEGWLT